MRNVKKLKLKTTQKNIIQNYIDALIYAPNDQYGHILECAVGSCLKTEGDGSVEHMLHAMVNASGPVELILAINKLQDVKIRPAHLKYEYHEKANANQLKQKAQAFENTPLEIIDPAMVYAFVQINMPSVSQDTIEKLIALAERDSKNDFLQFAIIYALKQLIVCANFSMELKRRLCEILTRFTIFPDRPGLAFIKMHAVSNLEEIVESNQISSDIKVFICNQLKAAQYTTECDVAIAAATTLEKIIPDRNTLSIDQICEKPLMNALYEGKARRAFKWLASERLKQLACDHLRQRFVDKPTDRKNTLLTLKVLVPRDSDLTKLIRQCKQYQSSKSNKHAAIIQLRHMLEEASVGIISYWAVLAHVESHLIIINNSLFAASFFRTSTVKFLFEKTRRLLIQLNGDLVSTAKLKL